MTTASDTENLDDFSALLFGKEEPSPGKEEETVEEDNEDDEEEVPVGDELEDEPEEDVPVEPVKPKSRFQERIDQLTERARIAEDKAAAEVADLKRKLDEVLAAKAEPAKVPVAPTQKVDPNEPRPDEVNEDGEDKYPLGEFDPAFIRDLTRYSFKRELEDERAATTAKAEQQKLADERTRLETEWSGKLETAKEKYPDLIEKNVTLLDTFKDLDPAYGDYLANTIMSMEYGPDVLYHLATNTAEARAIVNAGAAKATMLLGRLEARYLLQDDDKQEQRMKVSKAPAPPGRVNKGTAVFKDIAADTDDLDAFANALYNRRGKKAW